MFAVLAALMTSPAHACGGFFCNNVEPVVQSGERILFHVGEGQVTTYIEVQYEGQPESFAWVIPVPKGVNVDTDIGVSPPGLFDQLEGLTAPRFEVPQPSTADTGSSADVSSSRYMGSSGCGMGNRSSVYYHDGYWDTAAWIEDMTSGVEVLGEAVVGPYDIELIATENSDNLLFWLQVNGYQIPFSAVDIIEQYVAADLDFVGVKLAPDVPEGPVDTLEITFAADGPTVPLLLTSVAAVENMEVTAYVLSDERYAPANYTDLQFDYDQVLWNDPEALSTDYDVRLASAANAAGGIAWNTEYARPVDHLLSNNGAMSEDLAIVLEQGAYLTRFHTFISPDEMTRDPAWIPAPQLDDVDHIHFIAPPVVEGRRTPAGGAAWLLLPLLGFGLRRRD